VWHGFKQSLFERLLTSGEENIECVFMLKEDILGTACELTMLILSISVTFSATCLTVTSLVSKSCQHILVHFTRLCTRRFEVWW